MSLLHKIPEQEWPKLHRLMVARRFPNVPRTYPQARPLFAKATLLTYRLEADGAVAFIFGPPDDGVAFFDVICAAQTEGRWASKAVLRALLCHAFAPPPKGLGLRAVWVQPHGSKALRAVLQAGFQAVTPMGASQAPILVMTPSLIPRSLQA